MSGPVLLFSGGLDSVALWHLLDKPTPVYVRLGHKYEAAEVDAIAALASAVPDLWPVFVSGPPVGTLEQAGGHIPHRNLLLASTAAAALDADHVVLGALLGEASPDKSARFLRASSAALTASAGRPVQVTAPARRWTKTGLVRRWLTEHPEAAPLVPLTRSCYAEAGECGRCPACFRRHVALYHVGLRAERPRLPLGASASVAVTAARRAGPLRWPALLGNNATALAAVAGVRLHGDVLDRERTGQ